MTDALDDYPAAHSMDTQWYCVDANGHIGIFDTGEDGALPSAAAFGFSPGDPNFDVESLDLARLANLLGRGHDPRADWERPPRAAGRQVLVVDDPELAAELRAREDMIGLRAAEPAVLISAGELSLAEVDELGARPGLRWAFPVVDLYELLDRREPDDGLFHFNRDHGDDPGYYTRTDAPSAAMVVGDLPPSIRARVRAVTLPVDFAAQTSVHLADHLDDAEAETWGDLPLRYPEGGYAPASAASRPPSSGTATLVLIGVGLLLLVLLLARLGG